MEIRCERRVLANGLPVLVHEDHTCPIVAVNVWYHVGSKNEHPGRTGLAHLFEHLMFEGSEHHDSGYFQPLQSAGALLNGSTNSDRTNYWEVVPTGGVELDKDNIAGWFKAGVCAVGMGSKLITKQLLEAKDYAQITTATKQAMDIIKSIKS